MQRARMRRESSHKFVAKLFVSIPLALANPSAYLCLQSE